MSKICVFPSASEQEWQTIACEDGTAIKLWVEPGQEGYVRLQHLAHSPGVGWYVQKSFVIPAEALHALLPMMRKASCLMPQAEHSPAINLGMVPLRISRCEDESLPARKGA